MYEAEDLERGHRVALKTLRRTDPEAIYRLKREFRQLADLRHPNIAELYDLAFEDGDWFYTMELVDGVDFVEYCARREPQSGQPRFDEERLRSALRQLAEALSALHVAGKVHRDVKPSNVLVTREGRVVLLDFGLVTDVRERDETVSSELAGTVLYMAPEQTDLGAEVSSASDWYAVGVMLCRVLSGRVPFEGSSAEVTRAKRSSSPPPLRNHEAPDLVRLCESLLGRDPASRPGGADILTALAARPVSTAQAAPRTPLMGRDVELARVRELLEGVTQGNTATLLVRGESGIGKTALIHEFFANIREGTSPVTILEGRCLEREHIPYKAIDGLIDGLSQHWRRLSATDAAYLLPRDAELLPQLFPVLGRVPAVADTPHRIEATAQDRRLRALGALREVLHRMSARSTTILFLDDMQWVDGDTLALLRYLVQPPDPPPVLWILSSRRHGAAPLRLEALFDRSLPTSAHVIDLEALGPTEAVRLAAALLGENTTSLASEMAREAQGNPFFLELLARQARCAENAVGGLSLDAVVEREVGGLRHDERVVVEAVCLAAEPLPQRVATRAAGLSGEGPATAVASLLRRRLLRLAADDDDQRIEPYHDRIREAVIRTMSAAIRRKRFAALAPELSAWDGASGELLARAWFGAGDNERAALHARLAGDLAMRELAFEHAAKLYGHCIEIGAHGVEIRRELCTLAGDALANAGRGAEAAARYLEAASGAPHAQSLDLQFQAATQLLHGGHIDEGIAAMTPVLEANGLSMPASLAEVIRVDLTTRAWLNLRHPGWRFRKRRVTEIPAEVLRRVELSWGVFMGLMNVDVPRAVVFHSHHLRLSLASGDPGWVARAIVTAAMRWACFDHDLVTARKLIALAGSIVGEGQSELLRARVRVLAAGCPFGAGQPSEGLQELAPAYRTLIELGAEFEAETKHAVLLLNASLYLVGRLRDLRARVEPGIREARHRGDLLLMSSCGNGFPNAVWLASDDPDAAEDLARDVIGRWARSGYFLQHFLFLVARVQAALYRGDVDLAARLVVEEDEPHRRSGFMKIGINRVFFADLAGRAAIAEALRKGRPSQPMERCLARCRHELGRLHSPLAITTSRMMTAQFAALTSPDDAEGAFTTAIQAANAAGMAMHAAAGRYVRGKLVKGDEGRAEVAAAIDFFRRETVVCPEKFIAMLLPVARAVE